MRSYFSALVSWFSDVGHFLTLNLFAYLLPFSLLTCERLLCLDSFFSHRTKAAFLLTWVWLSHATGLPGGTGVCKEPFADTEDLRKRCGFDPWVGKIRWRRAWQHKYPCPEDPRGQAPAGCWPPGFQRVGHGGVTAAGLNAGCGTKARGHPPFLSGSL